MKAPLRTRFIFGVAIMLLPLLILAATAVYSIHSTTRSLDEVLDEAVNEISPIFLVQNLLFKAGMPPNDYLIHGDHAERERFASLSKQVDRAFNDAFAIPFGDKKESDLVREAQSEWAQAKRLSELILEQEKPEGRDESIRRMVSMDAHTVRAVDLLNKITEPAFNEMEQQHNAAQAFKKKIQLVIILVFGVGMALAIATGGMLAKSILFPLDALRDGSGRLGKGEFSYRINLDTRDELGQLAVTFNMMAERIEKSVAMLEEMASYDSLTGLFNKRVFYERLKEDMERSRRSKIAFSLLMIDIDRFKSVNDTFGHLTGDEVIRIIALIIKGSIRTIDKGARYGGEEFTVILCDTPVAGAAVVSERIRSAICSKPVDIGKGQTINVSVSIGVALFPDDAATENELVSAADRAMYNAKETGRNRVFVVQKA